MSTQPAGTTRPTRPAPARSISARQVVVFGAAVAALYVGTGLLPSAPAPDPGGAGALTEGSSR